MGEKRLFSPVIIPQNDTSPATLDKLGEFDITFFLNSYKINYSQSFTGELHVGKTCREIAVEEQKT